MAIQPERIGRIDIRATFKIPISRWDSLNIRPRVGWVEARNPTPTWVTLSLTHPTLHFTYLLRISLEGGARGRRSSQETTRLGEMQ